MLLIGIYCACVVAMTGHVPESDITLPKPHFHGKASDPAWLARVVDYHGHLGPAVVAGGRLGMAGLRAVGAEGYFDVDVTCEGPFATPPESCFLDGLQVATGATLGKRNLHEVKAAQIAVRVRNTRSGKSVEVKPSRQLVELLQRAKEQGKGEGGEQRVEQIARDIGVMADDHILTITAVE